MTITLQHPVPVPPARVTSEFGARKSNNANGYITAPMHGGRDYAPPTPGERGYPARAPGPGRVVAIRDERGERSEWGRAIYAPSAGNYVILEHNGLSVLLDGFRHSRLWTGGCHLAAVAVDVGDYLHTSDVFGLMGATGAATGIHLHEDVFTESPHLGDYAFDRRVDPRRVFRDWAKATPATPAPEKGPTGDTDKAVNDPHPEVAPMPILLTHEGRRFLLRVQPQILVHQKGAHALIGSTSRPIRSSGEREQLRSAIIAWRRAEERGAAEFGLGRYNGATLLAFLGDEAVEITDDDTAARVRMALGYMRKALAEGRPAEVELGPWQTAGLLRAFEIAS